MTWNQFDPEVLSEIKFLNPNMARPTNYKQQAKRELARRLKLEDEVKNLQRALNCAADILDSLNLEELSKVTGIPVEEAVKLRNRALGREGGVS